MRDKLVTISEGYLKELELCRKKLERATALLIISRYCTIGRKGCRYPGTECTSKVYEKCIREEIAGTP